jgi:hypothetical protein
MWRFFENPCFSQISSCYLKYSICDPSLGLAITTKVREDNWVKSKFEAWYGSKNETFTKFHKSPKGSTFIIQIFYNCDSPNNPLNCAFTLLSSNVNVDNQCVHVELQMPNLWHISRSIPCL